MPLAGVIFFGWDLILVLALFWAESGVVGVITVIKIFVAQGMDPDSDWNTLGVALAERPAAVPVGFLRRLGIAASFVFSYGLFWAWYGLFVFAFVPALAGTPPDTVADLVILDPLFFAILVVGLALSHTVSFWDSFIRDGEYRLLSPPQAASPTFDQAFALFWVMVVGATLTTWLGTPVGAVIALVILKIGLDIYFYLRQHPELFDGSGRPGARAPRSMTLRLWDGLIWFPTSVERVLNRQVRRGAVSPPGPMGRFATDRRVGDHDDRHARCGAELGADMATGVAGAGRRVGACPIYAPNAEYWTEPFREPYRGLAGAREYVTQAFGSEHTVTAWFGEPVVDGDRAVVPWYATQIENDAPVTLAGMSFLRFDVNGLVVEEWDTWNSAAGMQHRPPTWAGG